MGCAMGGGKLGGTNLTATGGGDVPGPSSIQQVSCIHFESLDLFLDMIRNKCIYENSINTKWVDFSFLEWDTLRLAGRGNYELCILVSLKLTSLSSACFIHLYPVIMITTSINEDNLTLYYRIAVAMISKDGLFLHHLFSRWYVFYKLHQRVSL